MSFVNLENVDNAPKRICKEPDGSILQVFPVKPLPPHNRAGYQFRSQGCSSVASYDADFCLPGDAKMTPQTYGGTKDAHVEVIQSAFKCSSLGATLDEIRTEAQSAVERNLWRSVDSALVTLLNASATVFAGPWGPQLALANAAQFLATTSQCGTGVIYGSAVWFLLLGGHEITKVDNHFEDRMGNIIIPSSIPLNVVYAFDSEVDVMVDEVQLLDELAPGITTINDRVVRAETAFTVAIDPCKVGSFGFDPCGPCC